MTMDNFDHLKQLFVFYYLKILSQYLKDYQIYRFLSV